MSSNRRQEALNWWWEGWRKHHHFGTLLCQRALVESNEICNYLIFLFFLLPSGPMPNSEPSVARKISPRKDLQNRRSSLVCSLTRNNCAYASWISRPFAAWARVSRKHFKIICRADGQKDPVSRLASRSFSHWKKYEKMIFTELWQSQAAQVLFLQLRCKEIPPSNDPPRIEVSHPG